MVEETRLNADANKSGSKNLQQRIRRGKKLD